MELVFMGTGTSQGVPMIAHDPPDLDLADKRNWRTRSSVHVVMGGHHIQVDASPEFRLQCIWNRIARIDTFILTHGHADHMLGMDDLRRFVDLRGGEAIPVYGTPEGLGRVKAVYPYAIHDRAVTKGYPAFKLCEMPAVLELPGGTVRSALLPHGRTRVLGLIFEELASGKRLAYFTDCKEVPEEASKLAAGADVVVLDALRPMVHPSHMSIAEATDVARRLGAAQTYFTHMTFLIDQERDGAELPPRIAYAYDGLRVTV